MNLHRLKTILYRSLLLLFLFSNLTSKGQVRIPDGFTEADPPKPSSKEWYSLNNELNDIGVKIINGNLVASPAKCSQICNLRIANGLLRGLNHGEFGGELIYNPDDKQQRPVIINNYNIKFLVRFNNRIYALQGLAHMSIIRGGLIEIDTASHLFSSKEVIDLGDDPEAFTIFKNELFIATSQNFFVVRNNEKQLIFKDLFWQGLYPNSIAVLDANNVFVGIRGGFVKLNLTDKSFKFYKYNK